MSSTTKSSLGKPWSARRHGLINATVAAMALTLLAACSGTAKAPSSPEGASRKALPAIGAKGQP